ncbi:putative glycoside hydrolase [Bacillus sp. FJAT-45350]|uniref:putative glycoside hydrolase n=1 Tax=Bacillus sp. FJAT-45350 TaxID=2011014 RepID=UPI000BB95A5C|nr:putative glycoside hydrolase [Bacillus sp. FJAT-45350]
MGKTFFRTIIAVVCMVAVFGLLYMYPNVTLAEEQGVVYEHSKKMSYEKQLEIPVRMARFVYDSGYTFNYPDAVRGIYVTGNSAGGQRFSSLLELLDTTELNSMVIDIKEDNGYLTYKPDEDSPFLDISKNFIKDPVGMMQVLEEEEIYPIARIVVFKDSVLAEKRPELSFLNSDGTVWKNRRGEAFVNPFLKEVWDYNIAIAEKAAKLGFQEIQFDYVRFPEGFERRDDELQYNVGEYEGGDGDNVQKRVSAVTDFVAYAREQLSPYDVDVSVDIFGYAATIKEAPGIGQNFSKISENVDVISSMIYPSHWTSYFGISKPDLHPYELVKEYAKVENQVLDALDNRPVSRPWIQDFTASWLGSGNYKRYGKAEVEAQIRALNEEGIDEFLLWNAGNRYTENVNYTPLDN